MSPHLPLARSQTLAPKILSGDRRALARLITLIENGAGRDELAALYPHTGRAHIIGVTGAPGTGKSTLVSALTKEERARGRTVGILSVDPSSPFSGGALLGDRIRIMDHVGDSGVFMRSMASRGSVGGLAVAANDAIRALDAFGRDVIFVETVGAGQSEIEIIKTAHSIIVVEAPGLGDEIQAFKAGILEIADVFVVNKADREGADKTANALRTMLDLGNTMKQRRTTNAPQQTHISAAEMAHHGLAHSTTDSPKSEPTNEWRPPIYKTVAAEGKGISEVVDALDRHLQFLRADTRFADAEREHASDELRSLLAHELLRRKLQAIGESNMREIVNQIVARKLDPHSAMQKLLDDSSHI